MSDYTTELRVIVEQFNSLNSPESYLDTDTMIQNCLSRIFSNYPIFDENYRNVLNQKIVKHYYFYEIGFETMGRFLFELNETMNRIMSYYNKLYLAWLNDFNPIYSTDLHTNHTGSSNDTEENQSSEIGNSNNFSTNQNKSKNVASSDRTGGDTLTKNVNETTTDSSSERFSDTPQGSLQNIQNNTYLSSATLKDDSKTTTGTNTDTTSRNEHDSTTINDETLENSFSTNVNNVNKNDNKFHGNTNQYVDYVYGYSNNASENLQKYYEALLNIDEMIIKDLADCFMMIF